MRQGVEPDTRVRIVLRYLMGFCAGFAGLLQELDAVIGPLSLMSSVSTLVRYARHGLHWIRLDTQKPR